MAQMTLLGAITMTYPEMKSVIEHFTGLEKDALHVHAALLLYILAMVVFRQSRRSRFPWLAVLVIELVNEALDLWSQVAAGSPPLWGESLKDLWNTMLWPTVLLLIGRYTSLFQHRTRRDPAE